MSERSQKIERHARLACDRARAAALKQQSIEYIKRTRAHLQAGRSNSHAAAARPVAVGIRPARGPSRQLCRRPLQPRSDSARRRRERAGAPAPTVRRPPSDQLRTQTEASAGNVRAGRRSHTGTKAHYARLGGRNPAASAARRATSGPSQGFPLSVQARHRGSSTTRKYPPLGVPPGGPPHHAQDGGPGGRPLVRPWSRASTAAAAPAAPGRRRLRAGAMLRCKLRECSSCSSRAIPWSYLPTIVCVLVRVWCVCAYLCVCVRESE